MQRRIIAAIAAIVLAGLGAVMLFNYVNTADQRAMDQIGTAPVLVVTQAVPAGTRGADIEAYLTLKELPKVAVVEGALTETTSVKDMVTVGELVPGEQLLANRFVKAGMTGSGEVQVPANMQLVTIPVDPARSVAASVRPGDKIGVYVTGADKSASKSDMKTVLTLRNVKVVSVRSASGKDEEGAITGSLLVTVALKPADAGKLIFAQENNKVYLVLDSKDGSSTDVAVTQKTVLK